MTRVGNIASDLAAGDFASIEFDWSGVEVSRITSIADPLFQEVFKKLWDEFGDKGEIEQANVLAQRLNWNLQQIHPVKSHDHSSLQTRASAPHSFRYEIIVVTKNQEVIAIRDHTAIIRRENPVEAIVHLSHALITPSFRGTGLAGWLRTWPIELARTSLAELNLPDSSPITLVCEMEPLNPDLPATWRRLKSYQKAGFKMLDPKLVKYLQPDFRSPEDIDRYGGPNPLPLQLLVRQVGKEEETYMPCPKTRRIITALYQMYGSCFRESDMISLWENFNSICPNDSIPIPLVKPVERPL